jgi:dynein assembly factor 3
MTASTSNPLLSGIGSLFLYGFTPALDLIECAALQRKTLNILIVNSGDFRHVIKTLVGLRKFSMVNEINFFFLERSLYGLARQLFHISLLANNELPSPTRAEYILDSYGNILIGEGTANYIQGAAKDLEEMLYKDNFFLRKIIDVRYMKSKDRDELGKVFKEWKSQSSFDIGASWDSRLREYYGVRYNHRTNIVDWDIHMKLKDLGGAIIYDREYGILYVIRFCFLFFAQISNMARRRNSF